MWYFCVQFNLLTEREPILQQWILHNPNRHELLSELTFWAISLDKMPFKIFWSSDLSVFPQKRKMHFKYAHSAKPVEVLINKFIFSVVSTDHGTLCPAVTGSRRMPTKHLISHICFVYSTLSVNALHILTLMSRLCQSSKKLVSFPSNSVVLCCVCHFVSIYSRCSSTLIVLSLYYICAAIEKN